MLIIGESLNGTIPAVGQAVKDRDENFIQALAREQVDCGAHMLDVNAGGLSGRSEVEDLVWMVGVVQDAVQVPFVLDSSSPDALRAAIKIYKGPRPILSSVTGEQKSMTTMFPLAMEFDTGLLALCMTEKGIPAGIRGRLEVAELLVRGATTAGMKIEDLHLDPLVMTIAADPTAGPTILGTLAGIGERFPQVGTICGPSNVSHGMPNRRLLNRSFISMLTAAGMKGLIMDVRDRHAYSTVLAAEAIMGRDSRCRTYLNVYRQGKLEK